MIQLLLVALFVGVSSPAWSGQACLDQAELSGLITHYEQAAVEIKNLTAQVSLYQEAGRAYKNADRVVGDYIMNLEQFKELSEQLLAAHEQQDAAHAQELARQAAKHEEAMGNLRWWRNAGLVTTGVTVMAVIMWMVVN